MLASYLDWWTDAGFIEPVQDLPCGWLQSVVPANDVAGAPMVAVRAVERVLAKPFVADVPPPTLVRDDLPTDIVSFDSWVREDPALPGANWSPRRIGPVGPVGAPIMVIADMPDAEDLATGQLLSGAVGDLFDAMLSAIGRERHALRISSVAFTRPAGGRWDDANATALRDITLHHIKIAKPQHVLLLGQMTCRLLTNQDVHADGQGLRNINHYGVTTATTAIHHPRLLLTRQALKRGAWTALKSLREPV